MAINPDDRIQRVTTQLSMEMLGGLSLDKEETFRPIPHEANGDYPTWRIRLNLTYDSRSRLSLDVNGDVILGRTADMPNAVTFFDARDAEGLGVSRQHAMLHPTESKLYIVDLGSTNGTKVNGHPIGVNAPYSLGNGDLITLGNMECVITILKHPTEKDHGEELSSCAGLEDVLPTIGKAITSQLDYDEVIQRALETTVTFTLANEAALWLVNDQTGELILEAGHGIDEDRLRYISATDTMAGKVIKSGRPTTASHTEGGDPVKVKTGYLVEAVIYVPIVLAGVTIGVLMAAHQTAGGVFTLHEQQVMMAIADFTAVAIQNARLYQAAESTLTQRTKMMTALTYALSYDLKKPLNSVIGYSGLLRSYDSLGEEPREIVEKITCEGDNIAHLIDQLVEVARLSRTSQLRYEPCDLVKVVTRAVNDSQNAAISKSIGLGFQLKGDDPYIIQGDNMRLYRSVMNLIDNAVKYSPEGSQVSVTLTFSQKDIVVQVRDTGPGVPEEDLPFLFDRYFRARQSAGDTGLGLGLEIVRATVEAHRGSVVAENAEDGGARFTITLPTILRVG